MPPLMILNDCPRVFFLVEVMIHFSLWELNSCFIFMIGNISTDKTIHFKNKVSHYCRHTHLLLIR